MVPLKPFAVPYVVVPRECRVQFPKPCFKGLKWGRWDCNVRGALRKVGSPGLHATVGVCGAWGELLCSVLGPRCCSPCLGRVGVVGGVGVKREGRHACGGPSLSVLLCCGGVLLSHNPSVAVPSALPGLASRFGMLLGVSPVL